MKNGYDTTVERTKLHVKYLAVFDIEWMFLRHSLSGRFTTTPLGGCESEFKK
jgi:hypothetical protein